MLPNKKKMLPIDNYLNYLYNSNRLNHSNHLYHLNHLYGCNLICTLLIVYVKKILIM